MSKSSDTGGVAAFPIAGRTARERERLAGMTDEERAWRKQYLADQHLTAREPVDVPELRREFLNPIRRIYRAPLDTLANALEPKFGRNVHIARYFVGKLGLGLLLIYGTVYHFKYNQNDWTRKGGWRVLKSKTRVLEGDPEYPKVSTRSKGSDYAQQGFDKVTLKL